jgi:hypothetical protein
MNKVMPLAILALSVAGVGCRYVDADEVRTLKTIVDASSGVTELNLAPSRQSPGDMLMFDEPLLDESGKNIGSNSGFCFRTLPGRFSECQWTLTFADGSITVAGREASNGTSYIPIIGGAGAYVGATGVMASFPSGNQKFTQVLTLNTSRR